MGWAARYKDEETTARWNGRAKRGRETPRRRSNAVKTWEPHLDPGAFVVMSSGIYAVSGAGELVKLPITEAKRVRGI